MELGAGLRGGPEVERGAEALTGDQHRPKHVTCPGPIGSFLPRRCKDLTFRMGKLRHRAATEPVPLITRPPGGAQ